MYIYRYPTEHESLKWIGKYKTGVNHSTPCPRSANFAQLKNVHDCQAKIMHPELS